MPALVLGLGAAALWGVSGFVGGLAARQVGALRVAAGTQLAGLIAVSFGVALTQPGWPYLRDLVPPLLGGLAGGLGLVCLFRALALAQMSVTAPIAATGVTIPIAASFVIGERPTTLQAFGIAIAIMGVLVTTYEARGATSSSHQPLTGVLFAFLAALLFGTFYLGLNAGGDENVLWTVAAARASSVVFLLLWLALVVRRAGEGLDVGRAKVKIGVSGVLDVAGNGAFTVATTRGILALAAVPAALYPLGTLLCARAVLSERLRRGQQIGASLALAGIALMAVPG